MAESGEGPEKDEKRPLTEHLTELRKRLLIVLIFVFVGAIASFPFSRHGLFLMVQQLSLEGFDVAIYSPIEFVVVQIYFMLASGIAVGIPLIIYESYVFMVPGLYSNEKKFFLLTIPVSVFLLLLGAIVSWYVIIPQLGPILMESGEEVVRAAISIERVFIFCVALMLLMGLVFQIPLVIALAVYSRVVTPKTLLDRRLYVYAAFFFLSSLITVDPTMTSQLILTAIFIFLYELSVRIASMFT